MAKPMATRLDMNPRYVALRYTGLMGVREILPATYLAPAWFYLLTYCTEFSAR